MLRPSPRSTLFPYTTLFRSRHRRLPGHPGGPGSLRGETGRGGQQVHPGQIGAAQRDQQDRKSTRLNSSHVAISYAVFCLKKKIYWKAKFIVTIELLKNCCII